MISSVVYLQTRALMTVGNDMSIWIWLLYLEFFQLIEVHLCILENRTKDRLEALHAKEQALC